jgi:hypothetical protein
MQVVRTKGEVGTGGRLRLDAPVELVLYQFDIRHGVSTGQRTLRAMRSARRLTGDVV